MNKPQKYYKRKIAATLHRRKGKSTEVIWVRYYTKVSKAVLKASELAILTGEPGDVVEITSSNFGYPIATVKLTFNKKGLIDLRTEYCVAEE